MSLYLSTDSWFNLKRRKSEYQNSSRWEEKYVWEGSWQWWDVVSESYIPIFNNRKPGSNTVNYKKRKTSTDMLMKNTKDTKKKYKDMYWKEQLNRVKGIYICQGEGSMNKYRTGDWFCRSLVLIKCMS